MFRTNKLFVDSVASYCSSTAKFTFCVFIFSGAPRAREARAERNTMGKKIW